MANEQEPGCAVVDCPERGHPQVCPYDGRYHHHGCIHYQNDHPRHPQIKFRDLSEQGWMWICNRHYAEIKAGFAELVATTEAAERRPTGTAGA